MGRHAGGGRAAGWPGASVLRGPHPGLAAQGTGTGGGGAGYDALLQQDRQREREGPLLCVYGGGEGGAVLGRCGVQGAGPADAGGAGYADGVRFRTGVRWVWRVV